MHCGRRRGLHHMMPPIQHPTIHQTKYKHHEYIVPEIHPIHTTTVNKHLYKHYHSYPHTFSQVDQVYNQHFGPASGPRPGAVGPAGLGPGGMGPGGPRPFKKRPFC